MIPLAAVGWFLIVVVIVLVLAVIGFFSLLRRGGP